MGGTATFQSAVLELQAHAVHLLMVLNYVFLQWGNALSKTERELSDGNFSDTLNSGGKGCNRYKDECPAVHTEKGVEGSMLLLCRPPSWGSVGAEERI